MYILKNPQNKSYYCMFQFRKEMLIVALWKGPGEVIYLSFCCFVPSVNPYGPAAAVLVSVGREHRSVDRFIDRLDLFPVARLGPGATVGIVETRVPRAGLPGPITSSDFFY